MPNEPTLRLFAIGGLGIVLVVPIVMIGLLVEERRGRRDEAVAEVSSKWGLTQKLTGPALVIPYSYRWTEAVATSTVPITKSETRYATFLPANLQATGSVTTEARNRGIFSVPVYRLALNVSGNFRRPNVAELGIDPALVMWDRAELVMGISDVRAISAQTSAAWNGTATAFLPGVRGLTSVATGIHAPVASHPGTEDYRFSFPLNLRGSVGLFFAPFAENMTVEVSSNSPNPNFSGAWLPEDRSVSANGFQAKWSVPFLGRNYSQAWLSTTPVDKAVEASYFGVELVDPIDQYRMAERSVKYAVLFIFLTFGTLWLIEVIAGVRIHPIQYLLLGAALCLFYLLELTLSEHLGFPVAYAIASAAVIALISAYGVSILGRARRSAVVGTGVTGLYSYLYVLLTNEDYALLIGSIVTFLMLAGIMFITRKLDWYHLRGAVPPKLEKQAGA